MKRTTTLLIIATMVALPGVSSADARSGVLDRVEDRIDRREDRIDRQTDNGPLDRFEDRVDRRESRRDRRGIEGPRFVDRWERRSWRRIWRANGD